MKRCFLAATLAVLVVTAAAPAFAQVVDASASSTDLWGFVSPAVSALASGLAGLAITWAATRFHALTGIAVAQKYQDDLHRAAETGIHIALDKAGALIGEALKDGTKNTIVHDAMTWVSHSVPAALDGLNVTPDMLRDLVTAKFNRVASRAATPLPSC